MTADFPTAANTALILFPVVLVGVLQPLSARTRRGIVFGVSLPLDIADSPQIHAAIRRFRSFTIALAILAATLILALTTTGHAHAASYTSPACILFLLVTGLVFWIRENHRLKPFAGQVPLTRSADLSTTNHSTPLIVASAALLPLGATAFWLRTHLQSVPTRWPRHWDAAGHVNGWGTRDLTSLTMPLVLGAFVVLMLLLVAGFMAVAPGTQTRQRHRLLAPVATLTWLMSLLFCSLALSPLFHPESPAATLIPVGIHMIGVLAVVVWMIVRSGFMSSTAAASEAEAYDGTPDHMWRAGIFYVNPHDPAVLVPKRFGMGWTLNFGRPLSWVYLGATLTLAVAAGLIPFLLH